MEVREPYGRPVLSKYESPRCPRDTTALFGLAPATVAWVKVLGWGGVEVPGTNVGIARAAAAQFMPSCLAILTRDPPRPTLPLPSALQLSPLTCWTKWTGSSFRRRWTHPGSRSCPTRSCDGRAVETWLECGRARGVYGGQAYL